MGTKKAEEDKEIEAADAPEAEKIGGTIVQEIDTVVLTIATRSPQAPTETDTVTEADQRTNGHNTVSQPTPTTVLPKR